MPVDPRRAELTFPGKFLKRRVRRKDGKEHIYHSLCESLRVHSGRIIRRQVLHLGHRPDCKQLVIALVVTAKGLIRFAHPCGAACWLSVSLRSAPFDV